MNTYLTQSPAAKQWNRIGIQQHHGINLPLFSLHSKASCGIGEYTDLIPLMKWCKSIGFDVIQLLPLNDPGTDTSPYCALSSCALNPLHIGPAALPYVESDSDLQQQIAKMQLTTLATQRVDYPTVQKQKELFFRRYFNLYGKLFKDEPAYKQFLNTHRYWLNEYALFKAIKELLHWQPWECWPNSLKNPSNSFYTSPPDDLKDEVDYQIFLQFLCFQQFDEVTRVAEELKILLKGDIPILINRESADVWHHRNFFDLSLAAGAPPDMYCQEGQKWGFPLYNWKAIESDDYRWWKERLNVAARLYHIYRIDHIVGFFRIWGIPLDLKPQEGRFIPEDKSVWIPHGEAIMRVMLDSCPLLPIGEDLGVVPPEVRACLKQLGICGTKVMRWERRWEGDKGFIPTQDYPPDSMTTVSTHDSETLELWWKNWPEEAKVYAASQGWKYDPKLSTEQRFHILKEAHRSGSLFHINLLQEYLALQPELVWPLPEDERINIPGLISDVNWSYRFKPSIEEMVANESLNLAIPLLL